MAQSSKGKYGTKYEYLVESKTNPGIGVKTITRADARKAKKSLASGANQPTRNFSITQTSKSTVR